MYGEVVTRPDQGVVNLAIEENVAVDLEWFFKF